MHSYIVTGGTKESRESFMAGKTSPQIELIHITTNKSSLTIKQIQELNDPLAVAPRLPRVVWIEEANLLTTPAQNALLKMLEEPPENTDFYLTCDSASSLLPTIRSRCSLVHTKSQSETLDSSILAEIKQIMGMNPGDRLTAIVKRDRSESLAWISQIELSLRDKLKGEGISGKNAALLAKIARLAQDLHLQLSGNCSIGLATQVFYLSLPKSKL